MKNLFLLAFLSFLASCGTTKVAYKPVNTNFKIERMTAHDLEEDDWMVSTDTDEILVYYSIAAVDENNNITGVNNGVWGINDVRGRGSAYSGFDPLDLEVPAKGKLTISIVLYEVDNENVAREIVRKSKNYVRVARYVGRSSFTAAEARALRMISRTLGIAGFALFLADALDTDDLLAQYSYTLSARDLQGLSQNHSPFSHGLNTKGTHNTDFFNYSIAYGLTVRPAYGKTVYETVKKPRAKGPFVIFEYSPLVFVQSPNDFWVRPAEKILEQKDSDDDLEWSNGFSNASLSARLGIGISPVLPLGVASKSRFFISALYDRFKFSLNDNQDFFAPRNYYTPQGYTADHAPLRSPSKIAFDLRQFGLGASYRVFWGKSFFTELQGGMKFAEGRLVFDKNFDHFPVDVTLHHDNNVNFMERQYLPFGNFKLGLGSNRRRGGLHLFGDISAQKYNYRFSPDYNPIVNELSEKTDFFSAKYQLNYSVGLSLSF